MSRRTPPRRRGGWRRAPAQRTSRRDEAAAPGRHLELVPPVLGPRAFVVARVGRPLLAVRDDFHPAIRNPLAGEVALGRGRAAVTEGEIVFVAAPLVGVAADAKPHR